MFKHFIIISIFWCFLFPLFSSAQSEDIKIDSLVNNLNKPEINNKIINENIAEIISILKPLAIEESMDFYESIDKALSNNRVKMHLYRDWSKVILARGKVKEALNMRHRGLKFSQDFKDTDFEYDFCFSLASFELNTNNPDSATYYNNRAIDLLKTFPDKGVRQLWQNYYVRAQIEGVYGNTEQQIKWFERSWEEMEKNPDKSQKGFLLYSITDLFKQLKNYERHSYFSNKLLEHYSEKGPDAPKFHFPLESFLIYNKKEDNIEQLKRVIKVSDSLSHMATYGQSTIMLARKLIEQNNNSEAIAYLNKALKRMDSTGYLANSPSMFSSLRTAYTNLNDYENAYNTLLNQRILEDGINKRVINDRIANYEVKYQTELKEREIEKQHFELQKKQASQKLLLWVLAGSGLLIILGSYAFLKIRRKNRQLDKQKILLEKTVDEKNVLLKEVHHRVKNSFQIVSSLLFLQSKNVKDKEAQLAIKEAQNRVRSMVLIHQKLYSKDDLVGIDTQDYFKDLTQDIFDSHQDQSKGLNYQLDIQPMVLDIETITPIGLILNELIVNVLKHAYDDIDEKNTMHISFNSIKNDQLQLKVMDNGKGFTEAESQSSFGLKLIKALAKKLKADLVFNSKKGIGTEAILNISKFEVL